MLYDLCASESRSSILIPSVTEPVCIHCFPLLSTLLAISYLTTKDMAGMKNQNKKQRRKVILEIQKILP